jgi:hypothetical protein
MNKSINLLNGFKRIRGVRSARFLTSSPGDIYSSVQGTRNRGRCNIIKPTSQPQSAQFLTELRRSAYPLF